MEGATRACSCDEHVWGDATEVGQDLWACRVVVRVRICGQETRLSEAFSLPLSNTRSPRHALLGLLYWSSMMALSISRMSFLARPMLDSSESCGASVGVRMISAPSARKVFSFSRDIFSGCKRLVSSCTVQRSARQFTMVMMRLCDTIQVAQRLALAAGHASLHAPVALDRRNHGEACAVGTP